MPCKPLDTGQFVLPPGPAFPGFVPQLPQIPFPDLALPIPDILALFNLLNFALPVGLIKPHFNTDFMKDIMAAIWSVLGQFAPFLMLYKFLLPLLNLILCILEVLCSLVDPIKTANAIIRLFRVCIPEFLALFPFFALILMIISLILLIIALIEYLINRIIAIIALIIRNILILAHAASRLDNTSIVAILIKIGDFLCLIQNLFVIFGVIALIIQIIKSMLGLSFTIPPCDSNNGDGCCTSDVCPFFIKVNSQSGITSSTGNFLYFNEVGTDSGLTLPPGFPPIISLIRPESWQFYDANLLFDQQFNNITAAFDLPSGVNKIFFPNGVSYTSQSDPNTAPYTISFRIFYDPILYGNPAPFAAKGPRFIKIQNAIVVAPPTNGVSSYNNSFIAPFNGTLNLIGGTVVEDDGTPIIDANNKPASIDEVFHAPTNANGTTPSPTDGILSTNIEYTFNINANVLFAHSLITAGCLPGVQQNRDFINSTIGAQFNANGANLTNNVVQLLPDAATAQQCVLNSINTLRNEISLDSVATFQTNIVNCLNTLNDQAISALTAVISGGTDQYKSTFSVEPTIQFITYPITIIVELQESSGNLITNNLPVQTASSIASQIKAIASFGEVSPFVYDGYQFFSATITSTHPGNGSVQVLFNNNYISTLTNPTNINIPGNVSIKSVDYTFVEAGLPIPEPYRDEGDVARD